MSGKIRAAVIGGSESGKTFLAMGFSRGLWKRHRLRSFVFDPWMEFDWGPGAWVTKDFERWKHVVTNTRGGVAIWDESTAYGGRDRENVPLFSQIRHQHPVLFCIGHAYSSILPLMRVNLTHLFITDPDEDDLKEWKSIMRDPDVMQAMTLKQYEFLRKRKFEPVRVLRHTAEQIRAGVLP